MKDAGVASLLDQILKQEDEVFAAFSRKVGVRSIREYEEKAKIQAEKLAEQQMELANRVRYLASPPPPPLPAPPRPRYSSLENCVAGFVGIQTSQSVGV